MELATYLQILNRRKWIIIITTVVTVAAYYFIQPLIPTTYEITTILRISPYTSSNPSYNALIYADRIMNNYVKIASSVPLLHELKETLTLTPEQPIDIVVDIIPDSEMLLITVEDYDPVVARDAANTLAELLSNIKINRDIRISVVDPAILPEPPSPMRGVMIAMLTVILGIIGGTGLAFIFENLDTRLYTTEQIEEVTGLPILGKIPNSKISRRSPYHLHNPDFNHGIRSLRTILLARETDHPLKTILITSTYPQEGKSTITSNLAISLALANRRTLIIDTDMYYPNIHKIFNLDNETGLSNLLEEPFNIMNVVQKTKIKRVSVLTSGPDGPISTELLGSDRMRSLLKQLSVRFDHIILDTPAFLGLPDTAIIAPTVDAVILVTKRGLIKEPALRAILQQLEQVGVHPLGVAVNHAKKILPTRYRKYYRHIKKYEPIKNLTVEGTDVSATGMPTAKDKGVSYDKRNDVDLPIATSDAERNFHELSQANDNLTEINGIGPSYEKALNAIAITTFAQLAEQNAEDLANRIDGRITTQQILRNQWIDQAEALSKNPDDHQTSGNDENTFDDTY